MIAAKVNLLDLDVSGMQDFFLSLSEKRFRAAQVMKWIYQHGVDDFDQMTDLSLGLREKLKAAACIAVPDIVFEQCSKDGTYKWLLAVDGGGETVQNKIEMVFIPERSRGTLCVSSQIGCALDCSFCSTARQGFSRNLSVAEMIGQVWLAKRQLAKLGSPHRVTNVVMMGMGEPLLNYKHVIQAVNMMTSDHVYGLSKRKVTISTSGVVPAIARMIVDTDVALAVSLHAPDDALRERLVPINKKYPIRELMAACDQWVRAGDKKRHVTYEYVMLAGINDGVEQARALSRLLQGRAAKVNLIPFNTFPGTGYRRSSPASIERFRQVLAAHQVFTFPRKTRGDDIEAACGQLVGSVEDRSRRYLKFQTPRYREENSQAMSVGK